MKLFASKSALVHVDLSQNDISYEDGLVINEGLKLNHQIVGLHMSGNHIDTDPEGFLTDRFIVDHS